MNKSICLHGIGSVHQPGLVLQCHLDPSCFPAQFDGCFILYVFKSPFHNS